MKSEITIVQSDLDNNKKLQETSQKELKRIEDTTNETQKK